MNEDRLRELLRDAEVPEEREAEERGLPLVTAAFRHRAPAPERPLRPRLALALAITALLLALVLSPAGARVRDWIGDVLEPGVEDAQPALTRLPGGGRLLVESAQGPWLVHADGSHRLLGRYEQATWSPRGLFVAATGGRTLTAVEPDGDVRWSLSRDAALSDPRWSPSGFRIAYLAGRSLRVVAGDGIGDELLASRVAPVAGAWWPGSAHLLAYVDARHRLRIANTDTGQILASAPALPGVNALQWSRSGAMLIEVSRRSVRVHELRRRKAAADLRLGAGRPLPLPAAARVRVAGISPAGDPIALLVQGTAGSANPGGSEVVLASEGGLRRLFSAPGRLSDLAWSPNGQRLLVAWPAADQWVFIPTAGRGRVTAVDGIARQFSPGTASPSFPRVEISGWCCPR
jgi:hypothetical protein